MAGILALTLAPLPQAGYQLASVQGFDKAVHFVLFAGFAVVLRWNLAAAATVRVVGISAALAGFIELVQAPLPYRTGDPWDWVWGVVGAVSVCVLLDHREGSGPPGGDMAS